MLVVFDLDGTLVDSLRDLADSANQMLAELGGAPLEVDRIGGMVGSGACALVTRALAAAGVHAVPEDALDRFLAIYDRRMLNHTRPYPGIPEVLADLERWTKLALVTNKPLEESIRVLQAFDLARYFPHRVGGDGPWPRKPSPDGLRWVMSEAADTPDRTLIVGDSVADLTTGRRAGTKVCLARYGFGFRDIPSDELGDHEWIADAPSAIPDIVRRSIG